MCPMDYLQLHTMDHESNQGPPPLFPNSFSVVFLAAFFFFLFFSFILVCFLWEEMPSSLEWDILKENF